MIQFFIPGIPAPGGSKKAFWSKKLNRAFIVDDAGERNKNWRAVVALSAKEHYQGPVLTGPLKVVFNFRVNRPKGHHGAKGVRASAPSHPQTRPDVLKLARSTEDALTGVIWRDDAQTVILSLSKEYADQAGCLVTVSEIGKEAFAETRKELI